VDLFSYCPSLLDVSFLHSFVVVLFLFTAASFFFTSFLFGEYLSKLLTFFSSFLCKMVHFVIGLSVGGRTASGLNRLVLGTAGSVQLNSAPS
jgi:hypothetical protein